MSYYVYMLKSKGLKPVTYVGYTKDIKKRITLHNSGKGAKFTRGRFFIGLMRPDGSEERLIAEGYLTEGPTWAPGGRVLSFFRQTPKEDGDMETRLFVIDITGYRERELDTPEDASDPAWSPKNIN